MHAGTGQRLATLTAAAGLHLHTGTLCYTRSGDNLDEAPSSLVTKLDEWIWPTTTRVLSEPLSFIHFSLNSCPLHTTPIQIT